MTHMKQQLIINHMKTWKHKYRSLTSRLKNDRKILTDSIGTQGTLCSPPRSSLNPDGSLKNRGIDNALHSIAQHIDDINFVKNDYGRAVEVKRHWPRRALIFLSSGNHFTIPLFTTGIVYFRASDSISWRGVRHKCICDVAFPLASRHQHFYDAAPVPLM